MNNPLLPVLLVLVATLVSGIALGVLAHATWRRRRQLVSPLSVDGLAERADVNGQALVQMAKAMRERAAEEQRDNRRTELLRWARLAEQAAQEHLECINAISLDALHQVSEATVHLGDFRPASDDRRRNPPMGPVARHLIRGGRLHG